MEQGRYDDYLVQQNLQNQAGENQQMLYASQMREQLQQTQSVLVEQTNPNKTIKEIVFCLMNVEENENKELISLGEPILNNIGITRIKFMLRGVINQNTILSHLEDKQINKLIYHLAEDIIDDLTLNWKYYGVKDKTLLDYILDVIILPSYFALQRAWGQNEKNWLGKISVEHIQGMQNQIKPQYKSFLDKFKL